ncbi:VPLPA-CTERM sorting domain-containing protein [Jannaschia sp. CCS1]|uniref:VPLPA-CTERM sorting domain-containing protein n=1 Tax=Jannaschia sp. (strain CCS1) TaxID=290400 RepID=UPI000053B59B|nr:VPLPA-CTERM sorting domain-containing protein [Jannaschia sp. CCS1]ABD55310.1 hypothetical protein Jann_2393 [Jannaschia sp. CCS1]
MKKTIFTAAALSLAGTAAVANTVDFENEAPLNPDPQVISVGHTYTNGGITFSSTEDMQLVGVGGNPTSGFVPNDTPGSSASGPASFGEVFLTGDFIDNTDMLLSFASGISSVSFDIVDIDGGDDDIDGDNDEEQFIFTFFNGALSQAVQTITSNDLTGSLDEAGVVSVSYAGLFDSIQIVGTTPGGTRNIGWGIDNINFEVAPVPIPAAGLLLLGALGGLGMMRRRHKA